MPSDYDRLRNRGRGSDETTGYEGTGYGSDFDFEGAGGFENRGGYDEDRGPRHTRAGGADLEPEYRDIPASWGRETLDWDTYGSDERGRGNVVRRHGHARTHHSPRPRGFRGVGPKGWSRSDETVREQVCEALHGADVDVSAVSVDVTDGLVTLTGTIADRWARRYVEDTAYAVRGVRDVRNRIEIE